MIVSVRRQESPDSAPYWQRFLEEGGRDRTVAALLDDINSRDILHDLEGNSAACIRWECSCQQKQCGACAMVVNGRPVLACDLYLRDISETDIRIEPLKKFPVLTDLVVDRSGIFSALKTAGIWLDRLGALNPKQYPVQYEAAKCLKCGLCMEICPNYTGENGFMGHALVSEAYVTYTQEGDKAKKRKLHKAYNKHFAAACSKDLGCRRVCPVQMDTVAAMAALNRKWF